MAPSFVFPQSLRALEEEHEDNRLYAPNPLDIASLCPSKLEEFIKGVDTISALWEFFCFNASGTTAEQSRGAFSVLCMAAKSSSIVLGSHLQDIIDIGFGRRAKMEPLLARTACIMHCSP
ncbi:hypothetical protein L3X38_037691 [Prunus dulcis]|uniref:Uncharacterized protein n=1 Tax=Prunus dulcis TaxID=3755 RepID=A0AAD4V3V7_PRUDU|nr:hypothetical protein L3X38_037691 [Prunus dulcis]